LEIGVKILSGLELSLFSQFVVRKHRISKNQHTNQKLQPMERTFQINNLEIFKVKLSTHQTTSSCTSWVSVMQGGIENYLKCHKA
jgi:hypothetical protein